MTPLPEIPAPRHADIQSELDELSRTDIWMNCSHYHCDTCKREVTFLTRVGWKVGSGVRAVGICKTCFAVMVEYEDKPPKFVKL